MSEVLGIVAAIPVDVAPAQVDHSVDDLIARFHQCVGIDEAMGLLQNLTDDERARIAQSPTPLAKFADVRTPDEIGARFMSLPDNERLQLLSMFQPGT